MLKCAYCHQPKEKVTKLSNTSKDLVCRECNTERKRKYRKSVNGRKRVSEASARAYINHKEKWVARAKVRYAVKTDKMIKPNECEVCEKKKLLQGHHEDYTKPLEVIWLCSGCHADADKILESNQSNQ